jgi:hypothetical protein
MRRSSRMTAGLRPSGATASLSGSRPRHGGAAIALLLLLAAARPPEARAAAPRVTGRRVSVARSGLAGWRRPAVPRARAPRPPAAIPFMRMPAPRTVSPAVGPGARSAVARLAGPPLAPGGGAPFDITTSFLALDDNNHGIPPDTMGAVGPSHLVTMLNPQVRVQDKSGTELGRMAFGDFWTDGTGLSGGPFDPKIVYDTLSGRWIAAADADGDLTTSAVWLAVSQTGDPMGSWSFFAFDADDADATWADFPGLGVSSKWIVITGNMYTLEQSPTFVGVKMWVVDKATALAGGALTANVFDVGFDAQTVGLASIESFTMKPAVTFDAAADELYLIDNSGAKSRGDVPLLRLSEISGTAGAPVWAPVDGSAFLDGDGLSSGLFPVSQAFRYDQWGAAQSGAPETCFGGPDDGSVCHTGDDCRQPGSRGPSAACRRIDTGDVRMADTVFRNGRLWAVHSGALPVAPATERTGVFWYEIDPAGMPSPIVQSGVVDPGGSDAHHFFPSIAVNANGDVCLGFSRSDDGRFAEAVSTGRLATDPPGAMRPVQVIKSGEAKYVKALGGPENRWGDYSATTVDPADGLTFWTIQEYAAAPVGGFDRWGTYWAREVPPSTPTPTPTGAPSVTPTTTPTAAATAATSASATPTPTPSPSATPTATATASRTSTATATPPATASATRTETPIASPTPPALLCPGDCDGDGRVRIDELLLGVNIGLGNAPVSRCEALDGDGSGGVTVNELIVAVTAALDGCGQ